MIKRHAEAIWRGNLKEGSGSFRFGATEGRYSFASRFGDGEGSTPEELIGAASRAYLTAEGSGGLYRTG
jgi:osmotically inducible protein OsmC